MIVVNSSVQDVINYVKRSSRELEVIMCDGNISDPAQKIHRTLTPINQNKIDGVIVDAMEIISQTRFSAGVMRFTFEVIVIDGASHVRGTQIITRQTD